MSEVATVNTVKLVSKKDGSSYNYDAANCRSTAVNAMFSSISFLQHGSDAIFPDSEGYFRGLKPGETYTVVEREPSKIPPETAAEELRARMDEKERSKSPIQIRTELLKAFHRYDTNHSGDIDKEEFRRILGELGKTVSEQEADDSFKQLDTDGNGVIDFQEFYQWWITPKHSDLLSRLANFLGSVLPGLGNWKHV